MMKRAALVVLNLILSVGPLVGQSPASAPAKLTLQEAEATALKNHPRFQASQLTAQAAQQAVTETKSRYYPLAYGDLTGARALDGSRIAAGALNNPIIFNRYANGIRVEQLVTDFGRTKNLVTGSRLHAQAEGEHARATHDEVLIDVDRAYFQALRAQALLTVAEQAVKDRQLAADQVTELAKSKLKSGLDVSFANVNLSEAQLMLASAQNDVSGAFAQLSAAMGYEGTRIFSLVDEPLPGPPPADVASLISSAIAQRPELASLRLEGRAAHSLARAERDLWFPTISFSGAAGVTPVHELPLEDRYAAAAVNIDIPIFNGRLYSARTAEARLRAEAIDQNLRDEADRVARDVRLAWLNAQTAFQRIALTKQLLDNASKASDLAKERYTLGLGSIVELSQAQLNQTQAQIEQASAKYDYQFQIAYLNYLLGTPR
ncbi:MAG: TolC family protein [Terriglobia bacterium]